MLTTNVTTASQMTTIRLLIMLMALASKCENSKPDSHESWVEPSSYIDMTQSVDDTADLS